MLYYLDCIKTILEHLWLWKPSHIKWAFYWTELYLLSLHLMDFYWIKWCPLYLHTHTNILIQINFKIWILVSKKNLKFHLMNIPIGQNKKKTTEIYWISFINTLWNASSIHPSTNSSIYPPIYSSLNPSILLGAVLTN